jgi:lipoxygenase
MARRDDSEPSGVKLVLEDYPYAADGLVIWEVIRAWVDEYVSLYYEGDESVKGDAEIQAWWDEIRSRGHADKKDEAWWPSLDTADDLKGVLTTMIWVVSGFHAAINFGQYAYGGYVPNRPCMTRRLVPEDGTPEHAQLMADPEAFFLSTIPSQVQATTVMAVVDSLSSHSPDEEYLGQRPAGWTADPRAHDAFARFSAAVQAAERAIAARNADPALKARNGAGVMPYELLLPSSGPGKTGRGIPNSISI